ncbi:hypothetical protein Mapa_010051 [Marchantia paleacea]|nr:hypothetical protein Mapa_010051 [Marchantia paleacea]
MADKLEARFSTLEDGVTRAKETLQEKLVGLEGRVQNLESVLSSKKQIQKVVHRSDFRDLSRRDFKQQTAACTTGELSQRESLVFASPCTTKEPRQHDNYDHMSTRTSVESIRPKCNERAWSLSEKFQDSPRDACTGVPASKALKSQAVREVSITHQCAVNTYANLVGTSDVKLGENGHTSLIQQGPVTSTREFIAGVRARFSRTLEVFLRNTFRLLAQ